MALSDSFHSYPSVYELGHPAISDLLLDPVIVEEKIDGSQISFCMSENGLLIKSKGAMIHLQSPEGMFIEGVETIKQISHHITPGWTYRGEYLRTPKHHTKPYSRIPHQHIILFDINPGHETYLTWEEKREEAIRLELEIVPLLFQGIVQSKEQLKEFLSRESVLGGTSIEGVVLKNYSRFGKDKKALMGKYVSAEYLEKAKVEWKVQNPTQGDILTILGSKYTTQARWRKAIQHLQERGLIEGSARDIGLIIKEVWPDIQKECEEEIKQFLWNWASPHLRRRVTAGLPEWYKGELLNKQFEERE